MSTTEAMDKKALRLALSNLKVPELRLILRGLRFDTASREDNEDMRTVLVAILKARKIQAVRAAEFNRRKRSI